MISVKFTRDKYPDYVRHYANPFPTPTLPGEKCLVFFVATKFISSTRVIRRTLYDRSLQKQGGGSPPCTRLSLLGQKVSFIKIMSTLLAFVSTAQMLFIVISFTFVGQQ